jgi:hypothetical protein
MEERTIKIYVAFDGTEHETTEACLKHEKENSWRRLIGLTEDQVSAALQQHPAMAEVSDALVTAGYKIANQNRKKAAPKEKPFDPNEPDLPAPVGREPPDPPMTAEEALNHTRA